jgi:hypothetical protein
LLESPNAAKMTTIDADVHIEPEDNQLETDPSVVQVRNTYH